MTRAFVREPSPALARCELTHLARVAIDVDLARKQHAAYVRALEELGAAVDWLPPLADQPDGVFVEDMAVVLPEVAVITRPGAVSRRGEAPSVEQALVACRQLGRIREPGTLDGGDVLRIGRRILVGLSGRTNDAGIAQLRAAVEEFGYEVHAAQVRGCLHLKSAVTAMADGVVLANLEYLDAAALGDAWIVEVDPREPQAANVLTLGGITLVSAAYPRTEARLREMGVRTRSIDVSELHKAESGVSCMSLILD